MQRLGSGRATLLIRTRVRFFNGGGRSSTSPNRGSYYYTDLLQLCKSIKCVQQIHAHAVIGGHEQNPFLAAKLVGKYTEHGSSSIDNAKKVFDNMLDRDVFLWNMVIQGYANVGPYMEALNVYNEMRFGGIAANRYTFPFVLKACAAMREAQKGQVIHGHIVKCGFDTDLYVCNALVAFYAKCLEIGSSRRVFDEMPRRDIVSWNSMISGYTVNEYVHEAILLFKAMMRGFTCAPDRATFIAILTACTQAAAVQVGSWVHSYVVKSGMEIDAALGSGLISMYGNSGRVRIAKDIFDRISNKNVVVWTAMIRSYGMHGYAQEAFKLFSQLVEVGLCPDAITFVCLLSTCSHAGMVTEGWEIFHKMEGFGVEKSQEHYACMVDLLGRAGKINEGVEFIETMPVQAGKDVYGALLNACRMHNNIALAERVAEKLYVLDPENAGRYITMAKMYEDAGRLEDVVRVRKALKEKNIRKLLGYSSVEVDSIYHTFGVEDESRPFKEEIFRTVESLGTLMEELFHESMEVVCIVNEFEKEKD